MCEIQSKVEAGATKPLLDRSPLQVYSMRGGGKRVGLQSGFLGGQGVLPAAVLVVAEWVGLQASTPASPRAVPL